MALLYNEVAKNLKQSAFMSLAFLVASVIIVICAGMTVEDYMTSYLGYSSYPTVKATIFVVWLVAGLPQALQMFTSYIIVGMSKSTQSERAQFTFYGLDLVRIAMLVWFIAYLIDGTWDYAHKASIHATSENLTYVFWVLPIYMPAFLESFILYGLLSEVLFSVSLGLWIELLREGAIQELVGIGEDIGQGFGTLAKAISSVFKAVFGGFLSGFKNEPTPQPPSKPQPTPQGKNKRGGSPPRPQKP